MTLRDRVLEALATVRDDSGVIIHGKGRVLAWRPPTINGFAVLIALDEPDSDRGRKDLRSDARRHPMHMDIEGVE